MNQVEEKKEEELTDEKILEILQTRLTKSVSVSELCNDLSINEVQLFGYIEKLKDFNFNVSLTNKLGEMMLEINNSPDFASDYTYSIKEDVNIKTKIGVISDLRFGSKKEQIALLNDMYNKFALDGVKYVIIAGNLLEGKYNQKDEREFGKSLITNDAYG